jgi:ADP-dependent phosphofructokinase/glucokinase
MTHFIREIENNVTFLDTYYKKAQIILKDAVESLSGNDLSQVINIFKSGEIQQRLDSVLAASR